MKQPRRPDSSVSTLLVRRVGPDALEPVRGLMADGGAERQQLERLAERASAGGVFVLGDVTRGPVAVPVAAAVCAPDRQRRAVRLEYVLVSPGWRRAGLGRRLIGAAAVLLTADGVEAVEAASDPASEAGRFLRAVGFRPAGGGLMVYGG